MINNIKFDNETYTDNDSTVYDSNSDTCIISEDESIFHRKKYNMVLCEIFNPSVHGCDSRSDPSVKGHYLVHSKFNFANWKKINKIIPEYKKHLKKDIIPNNRFNTHPFIRNYKKIISNKKCIKPEIAEVIYLSGDECVAILKTVWIRIFIRICKKKINSNRD